LPQRSAVPHAPPPVVCRARVRAGKIVEPGLSSPGRNGDNTGVYDVHTVCPDSSSTGGDPVSGAAGDGVLTLGRAEETATLAKEIAAGETGRAHVPPMTSNTDSEL
jgi:hypothetical protein